MTKHQPLPCSQHCEYVDWLVEQSALRGLAIRRLAHLVHQEHIKHETVAWNRCLHHDCQMAQEALEGKPVSDHPGLRGGGV